MTRVLKKFKGGGCGKTPVPPPTAVPFIQLSVEKTYEVGGWCLAGGNCQERSTPKFHHKSQINLQERVSLNLQSVEKS